MPAPPRDCPCHSGLRYAACCAPLHRRERAAATPEALMRSRYAAFALGLGEYLVDTVAAAHPDASADRVELARALSRVREGRRFLDLCILHTSQAGDAGEVLFYARIFERGIDRSFAELSTFRREASGWRYESGVLLATEKLPPDPRALTRDELLARA